jgi:hypothetical protein
LFLVVGSLVFGSQFSDIETAARPLGLCGAYTALAEGVEAIRYNPAGIARVSGWEVGSSYKHKWSGVEGLHSLSLGFVKSLGDKGNVGVHVTEFGASIDEGRYSETTASLSYAHSLTAEVHAGLNLNMFYLQVPEPDWAPELGGTATAFGLDIGLLARFHPAWSLGVFAGNLNQPSVKGRAKSYDLPQAIAFGVAFAPTETAITSVDIRKERRYAARLSLGQEIYLFDGKLGIRGGLMREDELTKVGFGFDTKIGGLNLAYTALARPDLPLSHAVSLRYRR